MKKIIINLIIIIIIFLSAVVIFLSIKGYETNRFNNIISREVSKKDSNLDLEIKKIKIRLDLKKFNLFLATENPNVQYRGVALPIKNLKIFIDFKSLIKATPNVEKLEVTFGAMKIQELKKLILRWKPSNIKRFTLNNVKNGQIQGEIILNFENNYKIRGYRLNGKVKNIDIKIKDNIFIKNTEFNFFSHNDLFIANSISANFKKIPISKGSVEIDRNNGLSIDGNINTIVDFKNNDLKDFLSGISKFDLRGNKIKINGEFLTKFKLDFTDTLKLKNYNYNLSGKIKNSNIEFKNKDFNNFIKKNISKINLSESNLNISLANKNKNSLMLKGLYSLNENKKFDNYDIESHFTKKQTNIKLNIDTLENIFIEMLNYEKNKKNKANLYADIVLKKNKSNISNVEYNEGKNKISIKNLELSKNYKFKSIKEIKVSTYKANIKNNDFILKYGKQIEIIGSNYDSSNLIKMIDSKDNKSNFSTINKDIKINLKNIITKLSIPLSNFNLIGKIEKGKFVKINSKSDFSENEFLDITLKEDKINNKKILEIFSDLQKPILADYSFFKSLEGGKLLFRSSFDNAGNSDSNLNVNSFKVVEAPAFAKLLALADLQGVGDLLKGDGISFDELEIKFSSNNKILKINELFVIGPSISILMDGYVENKSGLISIRGTMVPARNLNKLISKIPLLGDILIPKEIGEGLFGVSFKMKGLPGKIKTTVNPIKTLTPRFITKALEKRRKN